MRAVCGALFRRIRGYSGGCADFVSLRDPYSKKKCHPVGWHFFLEQDTGIEPASAAWEAAVLPMYESCIYEV